MSAARPRWPPSSRRARIGQLLHDFNAEYDEPIAPAPEWLAARITQPDAPTATPTCCS